MTEDKLLEVMTFYEQHLLAKEIDGVTIDGDIHPNVFGAYGHLLTMIPRMRELIRHGRKEKAFRWLGFIQGVLWVSGEFTLNEIKSHSRK